MLARELKVPKLTAIGILESLWHFTAKYAPQGNIGKHADAAIAHAIGWEGDAKPLFRALLSCRWIDKSAEHRLIVHDWHVHADDGVRKSLKRNGQDFLTNIVKPAKGKALGSARVRKLSGQSPDKSGKSPDLSRQKSPACAMPSLALPSPATPTETTAAEPRYEKPDAPKRETLTYKAQACWVAAWKHVKPGHAPHMTNVEWRYAKELGASYGAARLPELYKIMIAFLEDPDPAIDKFGGRTLQCFAQAKMLNRYAAKVKLTEAKAADPAEGIEADDSECNIAELNTTTSGLKPGSGPAA